MERFLKLIVNISVIDWKYFSNDACKFIGTDFLMGNDLWDCKNDFKWNFNGKIFLMIYGIFVGMISMRIWDCEI